MGDLGSHGYDGSTNRAFTSYQKLAILGAASRFLTGDLVMAGLRPQSLSAPGLAVKVELEHRLAVLEVMDALPIIEANTFAHKSESVLDSLRAPTSASRAQALLDQPEAGGAAHAAQHQRDLPAVDLPLYYIQKIHSFISTLE